MRKLISENRLKLASFFAVSADITIALAGGASYLSPDSIGSLSGIFLFISGITGLIGHAALLLWGKGGRLELKIKNTSRVPPIYCKPFQPWLYPLDFSFVFWFMGSVFYILSGILSANSGLFIMGLFTATAALLGWLWPTIKPIFGFRSMQITALLYAGASVSGFVAAFMAQNAILFAAMCMYLACNVILYTVRKENQSSHTQANEV